MLNEIIIPSFIKDFFFLIKKDQGYFTKSKSLRTKIIQKVLAPYPTVLSDYMSEISVDTFYADIKCIKDDSSGIYKVCLAFGLEELPFWLDDWFDQSIVNNEKILNEENSFLYKEIKNYFEYSTFKEVSEYIARSLKSDLILMQTPLELDAKAKRKYRKELFKNHAKSFVEFVIDSNLIGGIRVLENEIVKDYSWYQKVISLNRR